MKTDIDCETETLKKRKRAISSLTRLAAIPVIVLVLFGSFLTFPSGMPWMMLFWILVATAFNWRSKVVACPLAILFVMIVVKNPEWSFAMLAFIGVCFLATLVYWRYRKAREKTWWSLMLLAAVWVFFFFDFRFGSTGNIDRTSTDRQIVVCLGDSLTDYGYPQELEKLIVQPVADFGFDGITSEDGVEKLDEIIALKPRVLVLELGATITMVDWRGQQLVKTWPGSLRRVKGTT